MKNISVLSLVTLVLLFSSAVLAQGEVKVTQRANSYRVDSSGVADRLFPDWVIEFEVPANSRAHVVNTQGGEAEKKVLLKSLVTTDKRRNGRIIVEVKSGYMARRGYPGSIGAFASYLFVQYLIPNEPRGSQPRPSRPN